MEIIVTNVLKSKAYYSTFSTVPLHQGRSIRFSSTSRTRPQAARVPHLPRSMALAEWAGPHKGPLLHRCLYLLRQLTTPRHNSSNFSSSKSMRGKILTDRFQCYEPFSSSSSQTLFKISKRVLFQETLNI